MMTETADWAHDDERVCKLLSPFERVEPVTLRRMPRSRRGRAPLLVLAGLAAAAAPAAATLAATGVFGPLHQATLQPSTPNVALNTGLACPLIGGTAGKAQTTLSENGYRIEWRFQHWGSQVLVPGSSTTPGAVGGGYASTPETVPPDSIVWDITPDERTSKTVFVFVQAPNDPNAPRIVPPDCPGTAP